jgi:hypothetical protein
MTGRLRLTHQGNNPNAEPQERQAVMKPGKAMALKCALCLMPLLAMSSGWSGDNDLVQKAEHRKFTDGLDGLPWDKLALSDGQKKKVTSVRESYQQQIDELQAKIEQLKKDSFADCVKILTDDQMATFKKIAAEKSPQTKHEKDKKDQ